MPSENTVILMGNLTADPQVRYTPKGTAVGELNLAVNETYKKADGQVEEQVVFVNGIVVWGRMAETCAEFLKKGSAVYVSGKLQLDEWEDKETKQKKSRLRVRATRIQFLGRKEDGGASPEKARRFEQDSAPAEDKIPF
jgi:single-strand DNA-binding protein